MLVRTGRSHRRRRRWCYRRSAETSRRSAADDAITLGHVATIDPDTGRRQHRHRRRAKPMDLRQHRDWRSITRRVAARPPKSICPSRSPLASEVGEERRGTRSSVLRSPVVGEEPDNIFSPPSGIQPAPIRARRGQRCSEPDLQRHEVVPTPGGRAAANHEKNILPDPCREARCSVLGDNPAGPRRASSCA